MEGERERERVGNEGKRARVSERGRERGGGGEGGRRRERQQLQQQRPYLALRAKQLRLSVGPTPLVPPASSCHRETEPSAAAVTNLSPQRSNLTA